MLRLRIDRELDGRRDRIVVADGAVAENTFCTISSRFSEYLIAFRTSGLSKGAFWTFMT
ncbi:hypothetical protein NKH36_29395 [Mesorhizobium sp. M1312]|uniref:hypothetical protein n=1 Tax=unclassified Mesorhizobium TaxID=325217 RepID=UPI00333C4748